MSKGAKMKLSEEEMDRRQTPAAPLFTRPALAAKVRWGQARGCPSFGRQDASAGERHDEGRSCEGQAPARRGEME